MNHSQIVSFIWGVADLIRDTFKRSKYQDVILPLTVLRRLDCVLAPTKPKVLEVQARYQGKIENPDRLLRRASGFAFYNTSRYDFGKLLADAPHVAQNLRNYIAGFSPNMREVLEKFDFDNTISKLDESGLLFQVMQRFGDPKVNLHPDAIDNFTMGTIFEELIRKFNEALNENPGEHFTPRDVVHLMVDLLLAGDEERLRTKGVVLSVYDPCCGSGGMLTIAKEHITVGETRDGERCGDAVNPDADTHLFGQEVNPEDLRHLQSRPLHEVGRRPRRAERPLREHPLERSAFRRQLRLHDRQSALRQGLEARSGRRAGRARSGRRRALRAGPAADQRRPAPVPAAHARPRQGAGPGRLAGRDHHERLAALYRRRRQRRKARFAAGSSRTICSKP